MAEVNVFVIWTFGKGSEQSVLIFQSSACSCKWDLSSASWRWDASLSSSSINNPPGDYCSSEGETRALEAGRTEALLLVF